MRVTIEDMPFKILRSKKMKTMLAAGQRKAKREPHRCPGDGGLIGLIWQTLPNGWHYQVDWIHDTRFAPEPWIEVFAFCPGHSGVATHSLRSNQRPSRYYGKKGTWEGAAQKEP
jgi:hypothetical protein